MSSEEKEFFWWQLNIRERIETAALERLYVRNDSPNPSSWRTRVRPIPIDPGLLPAIIQSNQRAGAEKLKT